MDFQEQLSKHKRLTLFIYIFVFWVGYDSYNLIWTISFFLIQLDEMLDKRGVKVDKVLNFAIDDHILEERITGRWIHPSSGRSYHTKFAPPKVPGVDDVMIIFSLSITARESLLCQIFTACCRLVLRVYFLSLSFVEIFTFWVLWR